MLNGKDDEAANSLQWLRGEHVDIRYELQVTYRTYEKRMTFRIEQLPSHISFEFSTKINNYYKFTMVNDMLLGHQNEHSGFEG